MQIKAIDSTVSVSDQLSPADLSEVARLGFKAIINNRPDGEADYQPTHAELAQAAKRAGLASAYLPVTGAALDQQNAQRFSELLAELPDPVLAFCRSGTRSAKLWALAQATRQDPNAIVSAAGQAGYDLSGMRDELARMAQAQPRPANTHDVLIVGGGSAGIATAASLRQRQPDLDIAIIEPREQHYYQPGFTLAGAGAFAQDRLVCRTTEVVPEGVRWIHAAAAEFAPARNEVILADGGRVGYRQLVVAPGIKLDWDAIDGLGDTLGRHGVTSNYRHDLTAYTWQLVQQLERGRAVFTQPPMPIKCAGAPQKAMYLSCDHWRRQGRLDDIQVDFCNAGGVLFGVEAYVPALMEYVEAYGAKLNFASNLVAIDGPGKTAWFDVAAADAEPERVEVSFDMIHVCPPQTAPDFIRSSDLADAAGWIDVDQTTLRHNRYANVFGLGDACSAPNAKTMAAARKQAPVVAENVLAALADRAPDARYDGYGSCPLTVARGKVVLAEFGYGGKLLPSFPKWLIDGQKPTRAAWVLKQRLLHPVYYKLMLRGREWMARPTHGVH